MTTIGWTNVELTFLGLAGGFVCDDCWGDWEGDLLEDEDEDDGEDCDTDWLVGGV